MRIGINALTDRDLRDAGLKVTTPRVKILEVLEKANQRHLSAENVYRILLEAGEDIGLATVYRVLTQFEAAGLVNRHNFESNHAVFELDDGKHHDHIVCIECNKVVEFFDEMIEERQLEIANRYGFAISEHALTLFGLCQDCRQ